MLCVAGQAGMDASHERGEGVSLRGGPFRSGPTHPDTPEAVKKFKPAEVGRARLPPRFTDHAKLA